MLILARTLHLSLGWLLASSSNSWWRKCDGNVESRFISASLSWVASLLQDWWTPPEVRTLFCSLKSSNTMLKTNQKLIEEQKMKQNYDNTCYDLILGIICSVGVVPWKDRSMVACPGQRESSYHLVFLVLLRTRLYKLSLTCSSYITLHSTNYKVRTDLFHKRKKKVRTDFGIRRSLHELRAA